MAVRVGRLPSCKVQSPLHDVKGFALYTSVRSHAVRCKGLCTLQWQIVVGCRRREGCQYRYPVE